MFIITNFNNAINGQHFVNTLHVRTCNFGKINRLVPEPAPLRDGGFSLFYTIKHC